MQINHLILDNLLLRSDLNAKKLYPRYLLTLDKLQQRRSGVKHINLITFMLRNERFI